MYIYLCVCVVYTSTNVWQWVKNCESENRPKYVLIQCADIISIVTKHKTLFLFVPESNFDLHIFRLVL